MMPKRLLRFFEKKEHAEEFISGRIRIGELCLYKGIEGARQDSLEGKASFTWDAPAPQLTIDSKTEKAVSVRLSPTEKIKSEVMISYQLYLLCTTSVRVNKVAFANKYGCSFFVEINDSLNLLKLLNQLWLKKPYSFGNIELKKVTYDRGILIKKPNKYLEAPHDITYTQKSPNDKDDCEYRFVFLCNSASILIDNHLYLDIGPNNHVIKKSIQIVSSNENKV